jgi:hypothetical protein
MKSNQFKKWVNMARTSSAKAVEDRIKKITSCYDIGKQILKKCGPRSPLDAIDKMAIEFDINGETVRKLRAMANPETGYTKSELNQWFREFRKAGFSLTITHFIKLISVPNGRKRDALTRQAIKQKWSSHLLQAEILALQGRRKAAIITQAAIRMLAPNRSFSMRIRCRMLAVREARVSSHRMLTTNPGIVIWSLSHNATQCTCSIPACTH